MKTKTAGETMRLLVVEDEKKLNKTITERLVKAGYTVDSCFDGAEALYYIENTEYDGVLLDIMMPKMNGYEVLERMRKKKILTPVLMLTARDSDEDIVMGLDGGANDYITKPFSSEVLCARIRAMLRGKDGTKHRILEIADLKLDSVSRSVERGGEPIELSSKEYAILEYLLRNKGVVLSKERIESNIWNYDYEGTSDVIKVYIHHLRKKIDGRFEKKLLHTVKNVGYVIKEE